MDVLVQAVMTTLLIVGTCVLGWMPVVVWYVVYCRNCMLTPADISRQSIIITSITVNVLIVVKSCLDPIIYTMRMKDFQVKISTFQLVFFFTANLAIST